MILPNCRPAYLTPIKIQGSTNLSVNWGDIIYDASEQKHTVSEQRITGIASPITISFNWIRGQNNYLFYRVSPTPLLEGLTLYNIKSTDPNAPAGLTFDPFNDDIDGNPQYRLPCDMTHGFTAAGAYSSDDCDTVVVNNNDYVAFVYFAYESLFASYPISSTVSIGNVSNGDVVLDGFTGTADT